MEFTKEQMDFFKEEEKKLLERFTEPEYAAYEIVTTEDLSLADLKVSPDSNIFDYIAIGVVCLFKQITGCTDKKVYVWNFKNYSPNSGISAFCNGKTRTMLPNALSDFVGKGTCEYILRKCFQEDKMYNVHLADLFLYTDITAIHMGMQEFDGITLEFKDFNDTLTAQQFAFSTLRTLMISHWLVAIQAYMIGD